MRTCFEVTAEVVLRFLRGKPYVFARATRPIWQIRRAVHHPAWCVLLNYLDSFRWKTNGYLAQCKEVVPEVLALQRRCSFKNFVLIAHRQNELTCNHSVSRMRITYLHVIHRGGGRELVGVPFARYQHLHRDTAWPSLASRESSSCEAGSVYLYLEHCIFE